MRVFNDEYDTKLPTLPRIYKQKDVEFLSTFYKSKNKLKAEFVYENGKWAPTWELSETKITLKDSDGVVNIAFVVKVKEGAILKRVLKSRQKTRTYLFLITRFGLINLLYSREGNYYVLSPTALKIKDHRSSKTKNKRFFSKN